VANHTNEVLTLLKNNGVSPEWVQVGNETGNGMLWDDGKASVNMAQYAALNNAGYDAVKAVFPNAKVIVHLHNGFDNNLLNGFSTGLKTTAENGTSSACRCTHRQPIGKPITTNALPMPTT
jgi:arabinogalactan endo-1,4-beta-galactosidase